MPYVAPMPNPDMVTGPDWTTLLGSVALGLTKGVGEGAEILQRDKAQKMQQQRDAVEQAYRDRQAERAEQHWSADQAFRGDQTKIAQADREGAAWVEKLEGDLTGIDDNVSPEVADAARRHMRQWRIDKSAREYHEGMLKNRAEAIAEKERFGKEKHETEIRKSLIAAYWHIHKNDPKAANAWAKSHGLSIPSPYDPDSTLVDGETYDDTQEPWPGNPEYTMNPETKEIEPRRVIKQKIQDPRLPVEGLGPTPTPPKMKMKKFVNHPVTGEPIGAWGEDGKWYPHEKPGSQPVMTPPPSNSDFNALYPVSIGDARMKPSPDEYKKLVNSRLAQ